MKLDMTKESELQALVARLEAEQPAWKSLGKYATKLAAVAIASATFGGAGSLSMMIDEAGKKFFEPDLQAELLKLAKCVEGMEDLLEATDERVSEIGRMMLVLQQNQTILYRLNNVMVQALQATTERAKEWRAFNDASLQEFVNTVVRGLPVSFTAQNRGVQKVSNFHTIDSDVTFTATGGSHQRVEGSTFSAADNVVEMSGAENFGNVRPEVLGPYPILRVEEGGIYRVTEHGRTFVGKTEPPPPAT